ncbi:MAG TPA: XylR family transcriptional regulator, partial [Lachnospiraceae bacterium]|nr:XylR family transcriptional regulator [Lachnospiraceae bacterium]
PELIILGHDGVQIPGRYLSEMEEYINLHKLSGDYNHISVKKSGFGERAQLLGSACNVIDAIFKGNITI